MTMDMTLAVNSTVTSSSCLQQNDSCVTLPIVYHKDVWTPAVTLRIVTLTFIMIMTLFGNLTIIIALAFCRYGKLNSRVNIFIINLAIGDLSVFCFTMTTEVLFVVFDEGWILGNAGCKILLYSQIVTLASTTFLLMAMSIDRYMAICRPLSLNSVISYSGRLIAIAWIAALIFATPQLVIFKQVPSGIYPDGHLKYQCKSAGYTDWWQRKLYFTFLTSYILVIPSMVISYCYINVVRAVWSRNKRGTLALRKSVRDERSSHRAKKRTINMTLSIICSFIMCWTPYFAVHLIHIWSDYTYTIPEPVYALAETMALLNSALNPLLYGCFNVKLRRRNARRSLLLSSSNSCSSPKNQLKMYSTVSTCVD